ncbi:MULTISPECIES: DUF3613 domain-containing protein [Pseudomonas]|jgi:hypothetical protein|uniref:DUF3613 domain-containing protein n=1 Tax=Pseudomonas TaxID=286 RepID=UPI000A1FABEF|nr:MULTISPECIES: DUF3613 domain-containing protein [Pseudomonas]MCH4902628.1 DUF3613 domain-containing protein [Pseudomonas sp. B707]PMZ99121.1 DUF3613 domain-containing protein [Pseudomonas sp. FW305-BF15]PNB77664.1 DUF3613 domain-containing protein [Pseudomonas sp. FW305-BF6]TEA59030.1 DUF3613 domain-containing protein [Pseudomonas sp. CH235]
MNTLKTLCCLSLLSLPLGALAIDAGPASAQQQETEGWLLLQSRNKAASPDPQAATATERELAMQRWLKKYQYEIPDFYDPDAGGKIETKN